MSISAKFKSSELKGWIKNSGFFVGIDENGEMKYQKINPYEEIEIEFYFVGEYLGGKVNENLSFPTELIMMTEFEF